MVVPKFIGRLGNSMFQIAAAIGYAKKYGYDWAVPTDNGTANSSVHSVYPNLPKGNLQGERYHEHPHGHCRLHNRSYDLCHFDYHPIDNYGPNVTLTGFFQSWRYFEGQDEEIKKVFNLPRWDEYMNHVSIHVRRGDYVQYANSFPPITKEYIQEAQEHFPGRQFIVFSDDIAWCKQNIKADEYSERSERQDLEIMSSCSDHIIANSTFSWWGSWLGRNPDKKIIAPSCQRGSWFGLDSGIKQDAVDLLPPNWIQLKVR